MSMASQELKDIKLTLHQILQNQTPMMAQIVLMNKQQAQQHQQQENMANVLNNPAINKSFLDAIKSKIFCQVAKSPQQLQALQSSSGLKLDSSKHPQSSNAPKNAVPSSAMLNGPQKRKVELPMDDITNNKHRRAHSQKPECEGGMYANAELEAKKKSNNNYEKQSKANKVILQNQRFCSLCNAPVEIGSLNDHVCEFGPENKNNEENAEEKNKDKSSLFNSVMEIDSLTLGCTALVTGLIELAGLPSTLASLIG